MDAESSSIFDVLSDSEEDVFGGEVTCHCNTPLTPL
jgi:hypothetical protein